MPRLYHTKSKTGCKRCRARRVKCDESWPTCSGCLRHGVECNYDRLAASENSASPGSATSSSSKDKSRNPSLNEGRDRRYRELHLMHVFLTQTCDSIAGTHIPEVAMTWSVEVPKLAWEYEPLLSSIMAFSSHHMACLAQTQGKVDEYLNLRSIYLESCLQKHRVSVGRLNKDNADAASFTTVVLTIDSFASLRYRPLEPYEPPLQWLQLARGIGGVCKLALSLISDEPSAKIWPVIKSMMPYIRQSRAASTDALAHLLEVQDGEEVDAMDADAYEESTRLLCWILAGHESGEHIKMYTRRITAMPPLVPDRLMVLVERKDPRALVLLAHFFALASYAADFWWIGEMPWREVSAIYDFVEPRWQSMMEWPLRVLQSTHPGAQQS